MTQMRLVGRSSVVLMASLNIALFTPIEYSFGKMTSMSFNAMLFCLNKYDEEKEKTKRLKNSKRQKRHGLKRATNFARKAGALIGFGAMAVLMGGFGSVAAGSAFSIYNSLRVQDGSDS